MKEVTKVPYRQTSFERQGREKRKAGPTFDDVFLRVERDNGQVASETGEAGWTFNLNSSSLTASLLPVDEVSAGEGVDVTNTKVQRFWPIH